MSGLSDTDREQGILAMFGRLDHVARVLDVFSTDPAVDLDDFIQAAAAAVVEAAWKYDPDNEGGIPLSAWLWNAAKWAMRAEGRRIRARRARIVTRADMRVWAEEIIVGDIDDADFRGRPVAAAARFVHLAEPAADQPLLTAEAEAEIHTAIAILPQVLAATVRLRCLAGLDRPTVADMLGCSEETVDEHLYAARRHLTAALRYQQRRRRRVRDNQPKQPVGFVATTTLEWAQATHRQATRVGIAAAARDVDKSHMTLRRVWEYHGLPTPQRHRITPAAVAVARDEANNSGSREWAEQAYAYAAKHGLRKTAESFGVSRSLLYELFKRHGLGTPQRRIRSREWAEQAHAVAVEHGTQAAADRFGVRRSVLYGAFKKYRLQLPPPRPNIAQEVA